jgi:hypothetical protein
METLDLISGIEHAKKFLEDDLRSYLSPGCAQEILRHPYTVLSTLKQWETLLEEIHGPRSL